MRYDGKRKRRRGGAKGCLMCNYYKAKGCRKVASQQRMPVQRAALSAKEQLREVE